tara:strand:- start:307 stop:1512 length:1206 start_codon:yes stop_codon:yes gene_type:complete
MESQIISLLLSRENFDKAKALVTKDMFDKKYKTIFDAVMHYHTKYEGDLSKDNLFMVHKNLYPAMPDSTRELVEEAIKDIPEDVEGDPNFVMDTLTEFWRREMARKVGETAIDIWNGDSANFGDLRMMIDQIINQDSATGILSMQREETDVEELFQDFEADPDFPFPITTLSDEVAGTYRGNLGIIFARPESGKSSFCAFLAAEAIRKGHRVGYIMNEETAKRMKSRVLTAYFNVHKETYMQEIENIKRVYKEEIEDNLYIMDSVGSDVTEIDQFTKLNKIDVLFIDQLDKVKVNGEFSRGDERLKELYVNAREIAKRNACMVWAVSQASYDAHNRQFLDFAMLDGSKTGKAGEADIIIGIGKNPGEDDDTRFLCVSKNKISGWHGHIVCEIDKLTGRYYE